MRQHALSEEPSEFQPSLHEGGFWLGLSWCEVAKLVHVQMTLWADDGWGVPSRVRLGLVKKALRMHEAGDALCRTGQALCETLLDERMRRRLEEIPRAPCARCGAVGETRRKPLRGPMARGADKACYCERCLLSEECGFVHQQVHEPEAFGSDD